MQSHSREEKGEEKTSPVKRRKTNSCEILSSLVDNTVASKSNAVEVVPKNNFPCSSKSCASRERNLLLDMFREKKSPESLKKSTKEINRKLSSLLQEEASSNQISKPNTTTNTIACKKSKEKSHTKSAHKAKSGKSVKFVRIFPGPAGLVPDRTSDDITVESYSNGEVELESKTTMKHIETDLPKSSQDDKNLFSEKAWNLLLIDLPYNFFKEYGISTIKNKADSSHCNSMKVKFIAGILDYIDYSHDDPFIILKDSTGGIEGTIHRNILLKYPGILDPNVVIFVQDVGLLKTKTYVVTNKYHILISQRNLLAIYSNKGRIVSAPQVESVLSKIVINENCDSTPLQTAESSVNASTVIASMNNSHRVNKNLKQAWDTDSEKNKLANEECQSFANSTSMNDLDMNDFFSTDCEFEITEEQSCFIELSKENLQPDEIQRLQTQNTNHVENSKREPARSSLNKQTLSETFQTRVANVKETVDTPDGKRKTHFSSNDGAAHETRSEDSNSNLKSTKALVSYFTGDNEYDSDDEMLSQLDVDNV